MEQPCSQCGYVPDRPSRFCRQCGAPRFAENETTSAATRPQPQSQAADPNVDAPYISVYAQDAMRTGETPDTSRLYRPPMPQGYGDHQFPESRKSGAGKWILIALCCLLLVGGGVVIAVISAIRSRPEVVNIDPITRTIEEQIRSRVEEELRRVEEEARRAEEEALRKAGEAGPGEPPPEPPEPGDLPAELGQFKYPNAQITGSSSIFGNEFVRMETADSINKVKDHYKKQLGDPVIKGKGESGEGVIFQIPGPPSTLIIIGQDKNDSGKTEIGIFRSGFQLPKLN
jgi:hypothetical protein